MKADSLISLLSVAALAAARPLPEGKHIHRREVPQEHSHEKFIVIVRESLRIDNPAGIGDPVFGLLGNAVSLAYSLRRLTWPSSSN